MQIVLTEILEECKKGNNKAQRSLFDLYYTTMLNVCIRYVKAQTEAEDLLSQGFTKVFKNMGSFHYEHEPGFRGWIKKIMVNECLMFLRKKNNFYLVPLTEADELTVEDVQLEHIDAHYIYQCIAELPVGYRTVLNLYIIEGYSHAEIGVLLNIKEATSRSQLNKAKEALKHKLLPYKSVYHGKK
ncbi:sigma-70 family RNA polymerase sigma factor [Pedobacter sp. Du54]|uniref:RNA polymerase sigma factor n=1 Tax=Pedobacter anseongensis TaxID=3133439 RepID=UPI0030A602DE